MKQLVSWTSEYSTDETNSILEYLALTHCNEIITETELRERIRAAINRHDYRSLCDFDLDYQRISSASDAIHIRQALAFFQKRDDLSFGGVDKEHAAYIKFMESESDCRLTNSCFRAWSQGRFQFDPDVERVYHAASRKISQALGPCPSLSDIRPRFGPGATTNVRKNEANSRAKLGKMLECSGNILLRLDEVLDCLPHYWQSFPSDGEPVKESSFAELSLSAARLQFVPKDALKYRAICVEPTLNSFFQLGIGDYIARRLKSVGVDLSDQSRNQRLARYGSLTGALATLDLSSASDTVSTGLVQHLLPDDWFELLSSFRSGVVTYKGSPICIEKFSSMGNGYTFALESLIFWALSASVVELHNKTDFFVSIYGDDIIVPVESFLPLVKVLRASGFTPNTKKSFSEGPFRESCGADYFHGIEIRPHYVKTNLRCEDVFLLHNYYVRELDTERARYVLSLLHPVIRKYGPDGYGDGHLIGDWSPRPVRHKGYFGYTFETHVWKPKRSYKLSLPGDRLLPLYSIYLSEVPARESQDNLYGLEDWCRWIGRLSPSPSQYLYSRSGSLGGVIPGRHKPKLISVYTFSCK